MWFQVFDSIRLPLINSKPFGASMNMFGAVAYPSPLFDMEIPTFASNEVLALTVTDPLASKSSFVPVGSEIVTIKLFPYESPILSTEMLSITPSIAFADSTVF